MIQKNKNKIHKHQHNNTSVLQVLHVSQQNRNAAFTTTTIVNKITTLVTVLLPQSISLPATTYCEPRKCVDCV
eukprot:m.148196 g.148196  ORF g.148196 m.148196 type:complete len:73 (+) comp30579_c0_seq1:1075-1293(+)